MKAAAEGESRPTDAPLWHEEASDEAGYQSLSAHSDRLLLVRIRGAIRADAETERMTGRLERAIVGAPGDVHVFFDLEGFTRYESQVRLRYTEAVRRHTQKVAKVYIYASSRLVKMGAAVAGLVLPQLQLVGRTEFDDLLKLELSKLGSSSGSKTRMR